MRAHTRLRLAIALVASLLVAPAVAVAAPGDTGVEGPSYAGASAEPTGEKPESKLWFNDGIWWGSLWDTASGRYEIFRLNGATWASTNIPLDTRSNSRADTLWDGTSLYVASHVFALTPATGSPSNLYKFSYNPATDTYTPVGGWPQQINNVRTETLVIDKDSTGQLWATWVQNDTASKRRVHVNRTLSGDSGWGAPFVVPGTAAHTQVANDDISSVIAFGGNRIGVMWSNQRVSPKTFNFIVHDDSAADMTWSASVAITGGSRFGDDHLNLKSLHTDGSGRIFAIIKTSNTGASDPLIVVLTRSSGGSWSQRTVWTRANNMTRPVLLVDTSNGLLHAFAIDRGRRHGALQVGNADRELSGRARHRRHGGCLARQHQQRDLGQGECELRDRPPRAGVEPVDPALLAPLRRPRGRWRQCGTGVQQPEPDRGRGRRRRRRGPSCTDTTAEPLT